MKIPLFEIQISKSSSLIFTFAPQTINMKRILFALLSFTFLTAGAQTVDEVIQKYAANLGGLEGFTKIKTAKFTGTVAAQGNEISLTVQLINGKAVRVDVEVMGSQIVSAYKDGKGWKQNPLTGSSTPTDATEAEVAELKMQSMLASPLMDYKARGHQVELLGQEDVEGKKAFKINLTSKDDGKVTAYYINATDYSLIKSTADREMMGQTFPVTTWYGEPKEFNGVKFYMLRTLKVEDQEFQVVRMENIELNATVDEKIFDKP